MTDDLTSPQKTSEADRRKARLAKQLRDNLKRRKVQIRERQARADSGERALEKED